MSGHDGVRGVLEITYPRTSTPVGTFSLEKSFTIHPHLETPKGKVHQFMWEWECFTIEKPHLAGTVPDFLKYRNWASR